MSPSRNGAGDPDIGLDNAPMGEMTQLLANARGGDRAAVDRLFELLYPELKALARARLRRNPRLTIVDTTMLVNECYLRLQKAGSLDVNDRGHFLAYAARVIRTVIIDIARQEHADKRGGVEGRQTLDTEHLDVADDRADVLEIAEALQALAAADERLATVVEMRYFAGFSDAEIAQALGVTDRTVRRDWEKARAFLMVALRR
jgi:RNA polymerase sigma factor (TIGR02999 family)